MDSTSIQFRSHTALLLAAALPYLQPCWYPMAELAMKFLELSETMKLYREAPPTPLHKTSVPKAEDNGIFAMISRFIQDPEGLLHNLSGICTGKEKEIVILLLNLMQAKSFYENYGDVLSTFMSADGFSNPFASPPPPAAENTSAGDLSSMLSPEQADTLNLLKHLLDAE